MLPAPDTLAKIVLSPLLIPQGLRLQRRALVLPEAMGPREGCTGNGPDLRLLVLGDSSAAGVGVERQADALAGQLVAALEPTHRVTWQLWAKTGATTASTLATLADRPGDQFDVAVTALGVNDVTRGLSLRRWLAGQRAIFDRLEQIHGVRHMFVTAVPPLGRFPLLPQPMRSILGRQASRYDASLRALLLPHPTRHHISLDLPDDPALMARDGFHPGPLVYRLWAQLLATRIKAL